MTDAAPRRRYDLVTFGEAMARLSVPRGSRLVDAERFDVHVGGAEANVAAVLAQLGRRARWLGTLPSNDLGELVLRRLRALQVDTAGVGRRPDSRLGVYYFEPGVPPRPSRVIYDRADSAMRTGELPDAWLDDVAAARLLHLTGITAALGATVAEQVRRLVEHANARDVPVSFDVNHRAALWSVDDARSPLLWIVQRSSLVFCSLRDGSVLFGTGRFDDERRPPTERAEDLARAIVAEGPSTAVVTLGDEGVAALHGDEIVHASSEHAEVVDRVGAGDALAAGVIDGWLDGDVAAGVRRGSRLAALALAQTGDMVHIAPGDLTDPRAPTSVAGGIVR